VYGRLPRQRQPKAHHKTSERVVVCAQGVTDPADRGNLAGYLCSHLTGAVLLSEYTREGSSFFVFETRDRTAFELRLARLPRQGYTLRVQ